MSGYGVQSSLLSRLQGVQPTLFQRLPNLDAHSTLLCSFPPNFLHRDILATPIIPSFIPFLFCHVPPVLIFSINLIVRPIFPGTWFHRLIHVYVNTHFCLLSFSGCTKLSIASVEGSPDIALYLSIFLLPYCLLPFIAIASIVTITANCAVSGTTNSSTHGLRVTRPRRVVVDDVNLHPTAQQKQSFLQLLRVASRYCLNIASFAYMAMSCILSWHLKKRKRQGTIVRDHQRIQSTSVAF